jgi:hypothetical protein
MGNLHRPIDTWLGEEIGSGQYIDDVFMGYRWYQIASEVSISQY